MAALINDPSALAASAGATPTERGGNRHQPVAHVMLPTKIFAIADFFSPSSQYFPLEASVVSFFAHSVPARPPALVSLQQPSAMVRFQVDVAFRPDDAPQSRARCAHQMAELLLDRFQIVKDVGMIKLALLEDQRVRAVMRTKFLESALSKERAVVLSSASITKERALAQRGKPQSRPVRRRSRSPFVPARFSIQSPCLRS